MASRALKFPRTATARPFGLALATAIIALPVSAGAASHHHARASEAVARRPAGSPIMAIVSLQNQQVTIYDADGWILRAPVSTGQKGRETPAGVLRVPPKDKDHHSNLYDDASMPNMQRITWSGIALHGGPLPGYAASHGCVRMPYDFAERLFGETSLGMRVIIAPHQAVPVDIAQQVLPPATPEARAHADALAADAAAAGRKAEEAATASATAAREAARANVPVHSLENLRARAQAQVAGAEAALARAVTDQEKQQATVAKAAAEQKLAELETKLSAANADLQPKLAAAAQAREAAAAATAARTAAAQAAREAARELEPVSLFVSRKTRHIYVRRGFEPVLDVPVTIKDPDKPIGTSVFTAVARTDNGLRWTAVALNSTTDPKAVLDRITIPPEVLAKLGPGVSVRSSLIVSDEGLSPETGKGTEFVAVLSNEPQGGLAMRHPGSTSTTRYARERERPYSGREEREAAAYARVRTAQPAYQGYYSGWSYGGGSPYSW